MENPDINLERLAEQYPEATRELLQLTEALKSKQLQREGQESFLTYINHMWPDFRRRQTSPDICRKTRTSGTRQMQTPDSEHATKTYQV